MYLSPLFRNPADAAARVLKFDVVAVHVLYVIEVVFVVVIKIVFIIFLDVAIVKTVDEHLNEYWRHDDLELIQYEKDYTDFVANDSDLKKLKFPNDKYSKLLDIFIEPMLMRYYQDVKTNNPVSKKYTVNELIAHDESVIIEGELAPENLLCLKRLVLN